MAPPPPPPSGRRRSWRLASRVAALSIASAVCLLLVHQQRTLQARAARAQQLPPQPEPAWAPQSPPERVQKEAPIKQPIESVGDGETGRTPLWGGRRRDLPQRRPAGRQLPQTGTVNVVKQLEKVKKPEAQEQPAAAQAMAEHQHLGSDGDVSVDPAGSIKLHLLSCQQAGADLRAVIDANSERTALLPVRTPGVVLADLRVPVAATLGLPRSSGFRFLVWDGEASCLQPLSQWEEKQERPGLRSGAKVLLARTVSLGLPEEEQWPPLNIVFWKKHPPLPHGRLAGLAAGRVLGGLVCKRWAAEQLLFSRVARERFFWTGQNKPAPLGDNIGWAVELMGRDAMQYFGWRETSVKHDAGVVIRGGWDWATMFLDIQDGHQLIMRHPNNNNLTAKDLLYWNLRNGVLEAESHGGKACVPLERIVPRTFLTDDPEDCQRLRTAIRESSGATWIRKVADLHIGQGITPVTSLQPGDCSSQGTQYVRASKVVYQERLEPMQMEGRPSSLRAYVLIASLEPLVLLFNHNAGHVYVAGKQVLQSSKAWYTQHHTFDAWTFEQFDSWLATSHRKPGYFRNYTLPQMKDAILSGLKAARPAFTSSQTPTTSHPAGPRIWDTGHKLGSLGHFDLWCVDFMYSATFELRMLEMTDSCLFKGYGGEEQVRQRMFLMKDALEVTMAVQARVLQHLPINDLFPAVGWRGAPTTRAGNFELLYSEVPDSEYDYLVAEQRCDT